MKLRFGQAGRHFGEAVHQLGRIFMLLVMLGLGLFGLFAFRLSFGPMQIPVLASWLATAGTGQGIVVKVAMAELAWQGYRQGGGMPVSLQLGDISVRNAVGLELAHIPAAELVVPPADLFGGHVPLLIEGSGAQFTGTTAPVSWYANLVPGSGFSLARGDFYVTLEAGVLGKGDGSVAISGGRFTLHVTPGAVDVTDGNATLAPTGASAPHVGFTFTARRHDSWAGALIATVDSVQAQDLHAYWPAPAAPEARKWVLENITAGTATQAGFTFSLIAPGDLSRLALADVTGQFTGQDLTLGWVKGATPITHLNGVFTMRDQDTAVITASAGQVGGVQLSNGAMTIIGMSKKDQVGNLSLNLAGSVPDILAVISAPPLDLLRHAPPGLADATGTATGALTARIPFKKVVRFEDVTLHVDAALHNVALVSPVPPLAFTQGEAALTTDGRNLHVQARAKLGGEPATLMLDEDVTTPDGQVKLDLASTAGPVLWRMLGLETAGGTAPFTLHVSGSADGAQTARIAADLTPASLSAPAFGWAKAPGDAGSASTTLALQNGAFMGVQALSAQAPGLNVQGAAQGQSLVFSAADIGRTQATGTLTPPAHPGEPWAARFTGPVLDLRRDTSGTPAHPAAQPAEAAPSGPRWTAALNFTQLYLAPAPAPPLQGFSFTGEGQGTTPLSLQSQAQGLSLSVVPQSATRRTLALQAQDTGTLLRTLGAYEGMSGGTLALHAVYGDGLPATGTLTLQAARFVHAPDVTKFLQSLTLYGVAEAASGPGLLVDHVNMPFSLQDGVLYLKGARAFSASLGFTASGSVVLADDTCDLDATIIPAYALNALPGRLPWFGHIFSAEKGGGLFAMRAHISGSLNEPHVSINPLSALTPGFLRGIFGLNLGGAPKP
jgi:hypothetical protein